MFRRHQYDEPDGAGDDERGGGRGADAGVTDEFIPRGQFLLLVGRRGRRRAGRRRG